MLNLGSKVTSNLITNFKSGFKNLLLRELTGIHRGITPTLSPTAFKYSVM